MSMEQSQNKELHSLQTKLGIYHHKIEELEEKINRQKPGSMAQADNIVEDLKLKKKAVETQLKIAKERGETAAKEVAGGLKKAWHELSTSVDSAVKRFQ